MICPYCGKTTKDEAQFCGSCGHKIARCPSCNRVLRTSARFCAFDGTELPPELLQDLPATITATPPVVPPVPPRQVPAATAERVRPPEPTQQTQPKKQSRLPVILGAVLFVLLLIGIVVGVGMWQGWFSSGSSSSNGSDGLSVPAGETSSQSEAPADSGADASDSAAEPEDDAQSEGDAEPDDDDDLSSESAVEPETQSDAEEEVIEVPVSERRYEIVASDLSWSEACEAAAEAGGHLATITSEEEYDVICALAGESGLKYLWLGAVLSTDEMTWGEDGCWITGESWSFDVWYPGEPSLADTDGTPESCLCLWYAAYGGEDIGWTFNDQRDNLVEDFPSVSGKVGYVIEFDDGYAE